MTSPAGEIRILVVEDSEDDFVLLESQLRSWNIPAILARVEDEHSMQALLTEREWALVISDYNLPRFSFERALATLRRHSLDLPLIVLSGAIGEEAAVDAMHAGADDYIRKDNPLRLVPAIRRSIASAEMRERARRAAVALHESESMLRSLFDNLPAVTLRLDYDRMAHSLRLHYVGGAAERLLGASTHALRQDPRVLLAALTPADGCSFDEHVRSAAATGSGLAWEGRSSGSEGVRWLNVQGKLRERDAARAHWDAVAVDVSELKRAEAEVRELTVHLEKVKETERAEVAREIHDDIGALFFGLKLDMAWLRRRLGGEPVARERIDKIDERLESGIEASHRIVRSLRPAVLDFGVVSAAEWLARDFAKRTGIACELIASSEEPELPKDVGTAVFRVLQESLTNILRHAGAARVSVRIDTGAGGVLLEVRDDGCGVRPGDLAKHDSFGLRGMRERARMLGGTLEIDPADGGGTRLRLILPQQVLGVEAA